MSDELTEQVMDELQWLKRGDQSAADACKNIIALVRADERKRIREALLSEETLKAAGWAVVTDYPDWEEEGDVLTAFGVTDYEYQQAEVAVRAALAAIGLTEEGADHE